MPMKRYLVLLATCFILLSITTLFVSQGQTSTNTEIFDAAKSGDLAKAQALLKDNPDLVSSKDKDSAFTPLHWAAFKGQKDVAALLLANKADINAKDNDGYTPLNKAASKEQKDVVEL